MPYMKQSRNRPLSCLLFNGAIYLIRSFARVQVSSARPLRHRKRAAGHRLQRPVTSMHLSPFEQLTIRIAAAGIDQDDGAAADGDHLSEEETALDAMDADVQPVTIV
jgi:hypothetical protein